MCVNRRRLPFSSVPLKNIRLVVAVRPVCCVLHVTCHYCYKSDNDVTFFFFCGFLVRERERVVQTRMTCQ